MSVHSRKRRKSRRGRLAVAESALRRGIVTAAICVGVGMWGYAAMNLASRAL